MRIARIDAFGVCIPLKPERRMVSALGEHAESRYVLVRLATDAGVDGVGEATVTPAWSGETACGARAIIERVFAPLLIGMDPADLDEIERALDAAAHGNWFAKAAIESACWDVLGKDAGRPVHELLGGAVRPLPIRCRFSMGAYPPARARRTVERLVARGFATIKVKVGTDPQEDIERVRTVREALGPEGEIVIDANAAWEAKTAIRMVNAMEPYRIALVEQPTPRDDYGALAEVRRAIRVPVMADDAVFTMNHARQCVDRGACDVISVYPGKNGGIRKARTIAQYAAAHGVACTIGSNLEWDVASAAMCHLVAATQNVQVERYPGDLLGPEYHEFSIVKDPLAIDGPVIHTPTKPGLGIEADWSLVEANALEAQPGRRP
jgi:muconate cycloisomerase